MNYCGDCKHFRPNPNPSETLIEGVCTYPLPGSLINKDQYTVATTSLFDCRTFEKAAKTNN